MRPDENDRVYELCKLFQDEQSHKVFTQLGAELDELLTKKEEGRLGPAQPNEGIRQHAR